MLLLRQSVAVAAAAPGIVGGRCSAVAHCLLAWEVLVHLGRPYTQVCAAFNQALLHSNLDSSIGFGSVLALPGQCSQTFAESLRNEPAGKACSDDEHENRMAVDVKHEDCTVVFFLYASTCATWCLSFTPKLLWPCSLPKRHSVSDNRAVNVLQALTGSWTSWAASGVSLSSNMY